MIFLKIFEKKAKKGIVRRCYTLYINTRIYTHRQNSREQVPDYPPEAQDGKKEEDNLVPIAETYNPAALLQLWEQLSCEQQEQIRRKHKEARIQHPGLFYIKMQQLVYGTLASAKRTLESCQLIQGALQQPLVIVRIAQSQCHHNYEQDGNTRY